MTLATAINCLQQQQQQQQVDGEFQTEVKTDEGRAVSAAEASLFWVGLSEEERASNTTPYSYLVCRGIKADDESHITPIMTTGLKPL